MTSAISIVLNKRGDITRPLQTALRPIYLLRAYFFDLQNKQFAIKFGRFSIKYNGSKSSVSSRKIPPPFPNYIDI